METKERLELVVSLYNQALGKLVEMEGKLPEVPCEYSTCGYTCCVEPKYTLLEFARVFNAFKGKFPEDELEGWFLKTMPVREDGIPRCRFQGEDKGCFIYPIRPFVCRVYGHKALDELTDEKDPETNKYRENCPPMAGRRTGEEPLDDLIAFEEILRDSNLLLNCDIDKQRLFIWDWLLLTTKEKFNPEKDPILFSLASLVQHKIGKEKIQKHISVIEKLYHQYDLLITNGIKNAFGE